MIALCQTPNAPHRPSSKTSLTEDVKLVYETTMAEARDHQRNVRTSNVEEAHPNKYEPTITLASLGQKVQELHGQDLPLQPLLALSHKLQAELTKRLQSDFECMLPSHNYTLPTGKELGTYLALEVGGSTLRVGLVELNGRASTQPMRIRRIVVSNIDQHVRGLRGLAFFDWIAMRIRDMILGDREARELVQSKDVLPMGIAWSFPLHQTSIRSGDVIGMGKGFDCSTYKGHDLGSLITGACQRLDLNLRLDAIINDSSAAVLSRAYIDPSTRLAVVLGTGLNAAIHCPVDALHESKYGSRQLPFAPETTHVLVNTELSMFGKDVFPITPWDEALNANHTIPDYQPLEYLVAGGYMSEIVRLILVEATATAGLFNFKVPPFLSNPYSLDTRVLGTLEADSSPHLSRGMYLENAWELLEGEELTPEEYEFIVQVIKAVSRRSQGYFTAAIHALSYLLHDVDDSLLDNGLDHICIGCDGSIINRYPGYMEQCQSLLDEMVRSDGSGTKRVVLQNAGESCTVLGAAVAVAMANAAN
ncbi:MAG: hypothetical protein Q9221_002189 [Calogaya cf. arnoldii]